MEKNKIKTVEMIRKIRDKHYQQLKNKSHKERIKFYKNKSKTLKPSSNKILS